jgi:hypothetical protein
MLLEAAQKTKEKLESLMVEKKTVKCVTVANRILLVVGSWA